MAKCGCVFCRKFEWHKKTMKEIIEEGILVGNDKDAIYNEDVPLEFDDIKKKYSHIEDLINANTRNNFSDYEAIKIV